MTPGERPSLKQRNAEAVVKTWASRDGWREAWGSDAQSKTPSQLQQASADASHRMSLSADAKADELVMEGFLPSHPDVTEFRAIASRAANKTNRLNAWASALREAERKMAQR